jgi:hypothetical protein
MVLGSYHGASGPLRVANRAGTRAGVTPDQVFAESKQVFRANNKDGRSKGVYCVRSSDIQENAFFLLCSGLHSLSRDVLGYWGPGTLIQEEKRNTAGQRTKLDSGYDVGAPESPEMLRAQRR